MSRHRSSTGPALFLVALLMLVALPETSPAGAQATRTWVSGVGDDANPCSRTAPCKTLAGAISKTAANGEINVLDPAALGTVTITKSISIIADGLTGGILGTGTNGVIVNAGANDVVVLRGLDIEGAGSGLNGIRFLAGKALHVEDLTIRGFRSGTGRGIDMQVAADAELYVTSTQIMNNSGAGIYVKTPSGIGPSRVTINDTRLVNNAVGLDARDNAQVAVADSVASGNTGAGFRAQADDAVAQLALDNALAVFNGTGIVLGGPAAPGNRPASLIIARSMVLGNASADIDAAPDTTTESAGNNRVTVELTTPTPTPTLTPTPVLTLTPTPTPSAPNCSPRPSVSVSTAQNGPGQLEATVVVFTNPGGGVNTIQSLNFGPGTNVRIDVPNGPSNATGSVNAAQPAGATQVQFNVRRESAGAFTAPFTVVDACGSWQTFVGGGPGVP